MFDGKLVNNLCEVTLEILFRSNKINNTRMRIFSLITAPLIQAHLEPKGMFMVRLSRGNEALSYLLNAENILGPGLWTWDPLGNIKYEISEYQLTSISRRLIVV